MPYIGRSTDGFGVRNRFIYVASADDTSVSGADANGATLTFTDGAYVDVYLNGVLLKPTTDYNTSTANTIAGLSALNTNDEVTVVVYDVFTVADMVSATSGGTFSGATTHNAGITSTSITATGAFTSVGIDDNASSEMLNLEQNQNSTTSKMLMVGENNNVNNWSYNGRSGIVIEGTSNAILALGRSSTAGQSAYIYHDGTLGITNQEATNINIGHNTGTAIAIDSNGHVTMAYQSCFQARPTSTISNIADGSSQTLAMATEVFDQNADYDNSSYYFTAPVTGKYLLTLNLRVESLDTDSAYFQAIILTSNKEYQSIVSTNRFSGDPLYWYVGVTVVADMDASDTAFPRVFIEGSNTHQVDIATDSYFSGCLLA